MNRLLLILFSVLLLLAQPVFSHPGSGIVIDRHGNIYFVDTGSGIWKIGRDGRLTRVPGSAYHWMAIDMDNRLASVRLPNFSSGGAVVEKAGQDPTLLISSDFPIVTGRDGSLYYPWLTGSQLKVYRLSASGETSVLKTLPEKTESGPLQWLNGIAAGPDGSVYYSENKAIRRILPNGELSTVIDNVALADCDRLDGLEVGFEPYFRGLDVTADGTVYVAANGCRSVVRIAGDGTITTVLRSAAPWSPTGVAVSGADVYVLEYTHTPGDDRREWKPRVRKISSDGRVEVVGEVKR